MSLPRLRQSTTALLVVDVQAKLLPHIHNATALVPQVVRLLDGAAALGLPVIVTEQYKKGLGDTVPEIAAKLLAAATGGSGSERFLRQEKLKFSACIDPVRSRLAEWGMRSVLVCGIEAHVCVLQTCLDLAESGFVPAVAVDAIGSRRPLDMDVALRRMQQAGVVLTTVESALLELVHEAGTDAFRKVLPIIK